MAFIKISQFPSNDNNISDTDLFSVVDTESGENRKMSVGAFKNFIDEELDHYNSSDFARDFEATGIRDDLDSEHGWNVSEHSELNSKIDSNHSYTTSSLDSLWNSILELDASRDSALDAAVAELVARLDSEHGWNLSEHSALQSQIDLHDGRLDSIDASLNEIQDQIDSLPITSIEGALDSEHAWNIAEHSALQAHTDSVLAVETAARINADSDLQANIDAGDAALQTQINALDSSLDSEHAWNVGQHHTLNATIETEAEVRSLADSALQVSLDSEHAWNITEHQLLANADSNLGVRIDQEAVLRDSADSVLQLNIDAEATARANADSDLQANIDAEAIARANSDSDLQVNIDTEASARADTDSDLQANIDSDRSWNIYEHQLIQNQLNNITTDSVAEASNLYYTDGRVDSYIDVAIDSAFLNDRMPLSNLSDVQINSPTLSTDDVLQWNGSVWANQSLGLVGTVHFRGTTDATVDAAPADPTNGDMYVNTASGIALASWTGLTTVDSGDGLTWDSLNTSWKNIGAINSTSVVRVLPGLAISVDEDDTTRPSVAVRKDITDTWYYTQSQVDSTIDSEHGWNVAEHSKLDVKIDDEILERASEDIALGSRIDSDRAWNVAEHQSLSDDIAAEATTRANEDSDLLERISTDISTNYAWNTTENNAIRDSLNNEIAARIAADLSLQANIDSEHAWNVSEHQEIEDKLFKHEVMTRDSYDAITPSEDTVYFIL